MGVWLYEKNLLMIYFPTFRKIASENRHWQTDIRKRTCKKAKESCRMGFLGCYRSILGRFFMGAWPFRYRLLLLQKRKSALGQSFFMSESDIHPAKFKHVGHILSLIYLMFAVMFRCSATKLASKMKGFLSCCPLASTQFMENRATIREEAIQRWQCQEQNREG